MGNGCYLGRGGIIGHYAARLSAKQTPVSDNVLLESVFCRDSSQAGAAGAGRVLTAQERSARSLPRRYTLASAIGVKVTLVGLAGIGSDADGPVTVGLVSSSVILTSSSKLFSP